MKSRVLALVSCALLTLPALSAAAPPTGVGSPPLPRFTLPTRTGTVCLDSLRGKVVLVDFWASWCAPCKRSFPWLKNLHEQYAKRGLVIVAISLDKKRELAEAFLGEHPAPFRVAFDPAGKAAEAFKVATMPSSFIVGPAGTILYSHAGFDPKDTGAIEALIKEVCSK